MARAVEPERWQRYTDLLRQGFSRSAAARRVGISSNARTAFHRGDPSSSGVRWLLAQASDHVVPDTNPCPRCGYLDGLEVIGPEINRIGAPKPVPETTGVR